MSWFKCASCGHEFEFDGRPKVCPKCNHYHGGEDYDPDYDYHPDYYYRYDGRHFRAIKKKSD